ncbi:MAG: hypothetical protein KC502_15645, partial [Myxococcales bacterium]|nr:hypothetical protein [Myxococcales bacterium]
MNRALISISQMSSPGSMGPLLRLAGLSLLLVVLLPTHASHAVAIRDIARETPRAREAKEQIVAGNLVAVIELLTTKGSKAQTPAENALLGFALGQVGQLSAARKVLSRCSQHAACALTLGRLELDVGDRRKALAILGKALKRHKKHIQIRVAFGRALYAVGQGYQARQLLDPLADLYASRQVSKFSDQIAVARSLALNGYFKDANQILADLNEAVANRSERKLLEYTWAVLFLSKYNFRDADQGFQKVLKIDAAHIPSVVGMARIDLDSDRAPRKAKKRIDKALKTAPTDPRLLAVRAEVALMDEDIDAARTFLAKALKHSPRHRDVLSVLYATCALADDKRCMKKTLKTATKANKHDAAPHIKAAHYLEAAHRYDRVLAELKQALKRDPDSAEAHSALGMTYARLANDKKSFAHLDTAFRADGYNVRTANVLNVLYDGVLKHMPVLKGEFVNLRVHRRHRKALERTVLPFLQESYAILAEKYAMKAKPPLRVEIFPTTEQFSVRTVGLPRLGAHAVCFGHLITSRSPTEKPFNWKMVLHHEMAHVFHIQATDGRVPRWLTEGLAMMESVWLNPRYHLRMERRAYDRLKAGKLAKVRTFNLAFSQARNMQAIIDAYYQAMKLTQYLNDTYGFAKLRKLVAAHKSGKPTAVLVKRVLGVSPEQIDTGFAVWLGKHLARFDRDFHPTKQSLKALIAAKSGKKGKNPTMVALHQALDAMQKGHASEANRKLGEALAKADHSKNANFREQICTINYLMADLALKRRDWKFLEWVARDMISRTNCDGVRQRLWLARALRSRSKGKASTNGKAGSKGKASAKGKTSTKDRKAEALVHLRKAAEIDPHNPLVKRFLLAVLPKTT